MRRAAPALALAASLMLAAACTPAVRPPAAASEASAVRPVVIAHRGASSYRPEHTLEAYALAIEQGADFIEPDLVPTRDGVLVARHENELSDSTDVAARPEFADRRTTKRVDGEAVTGWFSEDFTLAEIRTLRARERLPQLRPGSAAHDGRYRVPTLQEVIALVREAEARGRRVGIYPETKHPTYFAREGRRLDGSPIGAPLGAMLLEVLVTEGFTDPARIYIQSFEVENLLELATTLMPARGLDLPLVQLFGDLGNAGLPAGGAFSAPYDIRFHAAAGHDLDAIYGGLGALLPRGLGAGTGYAELAAPAVLAWMRQRYARGVGPWIASLLPRERVAGADGVPARLADRPPHPLLAAARAAGLEVHPYTLRPEPAFRVLGRDGAPLSLEDEGVELLRLGATGWFVDAPDRGVAARARFLDALARPGPR